MKLKTIVAGVSVFALIALLSAPVSADETRGLYSGATALWSFYDIGGSVDENATFSEDDDLGYDVFAGYQLCEYLGVEGGWVNHGSVDGEAREDELTSVDAETEGPFAQVVGSYPVEAIGGGLRIIGALGAYFYDMDVTAKTGGVGTRFEAGSGSGVAPIVGIGVQLPVAKYVTLRFAYRRFFEVEDVDLDTIGLSIVFTQWN